MKNENNKGSEDSISENEKRLDEIKDVLSKKSEKNSLLTQEELDLLRSNVEELKKSYQTGQVEEVPVKKNVEKKTKDVINIHADATDQKNTSKESEEVPVKKNVEKKTKDVINIHADATDQKNTSKESTEKSPVLDDKVSYRDEKQPVPTIDPENMPKSALTEALKKSKDNKNDERGNEEGKKEHQEAKVEEKSQTGNETGEKSQTGSETREESQTTGVNEEKSQDSIGFQSSLFESSSSPSDEEILKKPSVKPQPFPRQPIEAFPTNRPSVKRSEFKKPYPSAQEKGFDNTISEARKAAMPEQPLSSESQATPGVEQPEASVNAEVQVADPQNAVAIPQQHIGITPSHYISYWSPRIICSIPAFYLLMIILYKILSFVLPTNSKTDVRNQTRDRTRNKEEKPPEERPNDRPSIFVFTYLLKGPVKLAQWLVATRDLPELDKRIKKSMISRVVAIIDEDRKGVIVEILLSDFSTFTSVDNRITSFVELSRLDELLLMIELIISNLEQSFPARLVTDALLGTVKEI